MPVLIVYLDLAESLSCFDKIAFGEIHTAKINPLDNGQHETHGQHDGGRNDEGVRASLLQEVPRTEQQCEYAQEYRHGNRVVEA